MSNLIKRFVREDEGTVSIEYAILLGMIVAGLILVVAAVGKWVSDRWNTVQTDLGA